MNNALDNLVADIDRLVSEMGSNLPLDETSRRWYAAISAQFLSFNRRLRDAIKEERTSRQEMEKPIEASNMKSMREALETLLNLAYEVQDINNENGPKTSVPAQFIINVAKSALAKAPRNCDVGSAEEQTWRMENRYCCAKMECCALPNSGFKGCPLYHDGIDCRLAWAQMPYEEGGVK